MEIDALSPRIHAEKRRNLVKFYYPIIDAMLYASNQLTNDTIKKYIADVEFRRPDTAEHTKESVKPALLLENILDEAIKIDPVKGDFYFLQDIVGDNGVMSTAATLLFASLQDNLSPEATIDDIIAERLSLSAQQRMLLLSGDDIIHRFNENENGKFEKIIANGDEEAFINCLELLDVQPRYRRKLISLYKDFDEHILSVAEMLRPIVDIIIANESIYAQSVIAMGEKIEAADDDLVSYVKDLCGLVLPSSMSFQTYISVLSPNTLTVNDRINSTSDLLFGICFADLAEMLHNRYDNARIISSFKALADETRFDVLHCICASPRFGLELANIMGVTASAVSYHVNKLIEHGFVESTLIKGKVYFKPRMENIEKVWNSFLDVLKSPYVPHGSYNDKNE